MYVEHVNDKSKLDDVVRLLINGTNKDINTQMKEWTLQFPLKKEQQIM